MEQNEMSWFLSEGRDQDQLTPITPAPAGICLDYWPSPTKLGYPKNQMEQNERSWFLSQRRCAKPKHQARK